MKVVSGDCDTEISYSCYTVQLASPATNNPSTKINSIAICAGSGGSIFKGVDADLYLTGEMSHVRQYSSRLHVYPTTH